MSMGHLCKSGLYLYMHSNILCYPVICMLHILLDWVSLVHQCEIPLVVTVPCSQLVLPPLQHNTHTLNETMCIAISMSSDLGQNRNIHAKVAFLEAFRTGVPLVHSDSCATTLCLGQMLGQWLDDALEDFQYLPY